LFAAALLVALLGGVFLAQLTGHPRTLDRLALGATLGLAVWSGLGFALASFAGMSRGVALLTALATLAVGVFARTTRPRRETAASPAAAPTRIRGAILAALVSLLVFRLADRVLIQTEQGVSIGNNHNLGDLPFHMAIAASFAWGENFPPRHPELAGVPLTYPFLGDFLSALLLALGASWRDAFFWPSFILGLTVIAALVRFGESLTGSRTVGRIAAALTVFSGGLGFSDLARSGGFERWLSGGLELTIRETGLRYGNFVVTLLIPQRSILFGWPLLFFALAAVWSALRPNESPRHELDLTTRINIARRAGFIIGLLPLIHSHSFAVAVFVLGFVLFASPASPLRRDIASTTLTALALVAAPSLLFMAARNSLETAKFFAWSPGFDRGHWSIGTFWLWNAGLFLPLAAVGASLTARRRAPPGLFLAPFGVLFALANLFQLSPWIWDNIKFLAPAHAGLAVFAALALRAIAARGHGQRAVAIGLGGLACLSGGLDVLRLASGRVEHRLFSAEDIAFGDAVRRALPPGSVVLVASAHDHPVLLSGRPLYLGYEGHIWSQGLNARGRKGEVTGFFTPSTARRAPVVLPAPVDAVAWTSRELSTFGPREDLLSALSPLVTSPYRLYVAQNGGQRTVKQP
jgi:hypothetical protein